MSYDIGSYIDLTHINRKSSGGSPSAFKSTTSLYEVGARFVFRIVEGRLVAARQIPVSFA